jgi:formylglycine-generating enzyme required for sulfatase activity
MKQRGAEKTRTCGSFFSTHGSEDATSQQRHLSPLMRIFLATVWIQIASGSGSASVFASESPSFIASTEATQEITSCGCSNGLNRQSQSQHSSPNNLYENEITSDSQSRAAHSDISQKSPNKMVFVEGGTFTMGTSKPMIPLVCPIISSNTDPSLLRDCF